MDQKNTPTPNTQKTNKYSDTTHDKTAMGHNPNKHSDKNTASEKTTPVTSR